MFIDCATDGPSPRFHALESLVAQVLVQLLEVDEHAAQVRRKVEAAVSVQVPVPRPTARACIFLDFFIVRPVYYFVNAGDCIWSH